MSAEIYDNLSKRFSKGCSFGKSYLLIENRAKLWRDSYRVKSSVLLLQFRAGRRTFLPLNGSLW